MIRPPCVGFRSVDNTEFAWSGGLKVPTHVDDDSGDDFEDDDSGDDFEDEWQWIDGSDNAVLNCGHKGCNLWAPSEPA